MLSRSVCSVKNSVRHRARIDYGWIIFSRIILASATPSEMTDTTLGELRGQGVSSVSSLASRPVIAEVGYVPTVPRQSSTPARQIDCPPGARAEGRSGRGWRGVQIAAIG
jgi:hypothetical protein